MTPVLLSRNVVHRKNHARSQETITVRCARVPTSLPTGAVTRWLDALPEMFRSTLASRLSKAVGMETLTGLALLGSMSLACRLPPLDRLRRTNRGKPWFPGGPHFSITHSGGFAACAVAPRGLTIGIDLEPVNRAGIEAIRAVANVEERDSLDSSSITATELWTAKEAVLKAAGAALADICRVSVDHDRARFAGVDYYVRSYPLNEDLLLAIALERQIPEFKIDWPPPSELFGLPDECNCGQHECKTPALQSLDFPAEFG